MDAGPAFYLDVAVPRPIWPPNGSSRSCRSRASGSRSSTRAPGRRLGCMALRGRARDRAVAVRANRRGPWPAAGPVARGAAVRLVAGAARGHLREGCRQGRGLLAGGVPPGVRGRPRSLRGGQRRHRRRRVRDPSACPAHGRRDARDEQVARPVRPSSPASAACDRCRPSGSPARCSTGTPSWSARRPRWPAPDRSGPNLLALRCARRGADGHKVRHRCPRSRCPACPTPWRRARS